MKSTENNIMKFCLFFCDLENSFLILPWSKNSKITFFELHFLENNSVYDLFFLIFSKPENQNNFSLSKNPVSRNHSLYKSFSETKTALILKGKKEDDWQSPSFFGQLLQ